jgi:hypothetical protein
MLALAPSRRSSPLIRKGLWLFLVVAAVAACRPTQVREPGWSDQERAQTLFDGVCAVTAGGRIRCSIPADEAAVGALHEPIRSMQGGVGRSDWPRCAVTESGRVACWGCGENVGQRYRQRSSAPPRFMPLGHVKQVAVSQAGACALDDSGIVTCWGEGFESRVLEVTDTEICRPRPGSFRRLAGFPAAERIAMTADGRACVVTSGGSVYCQGVYYTPQDEWFRLQAPSVGLSSPIPDSGVRQVVVPRARDIVAGAAHFCALGHDGTVTCWDENSYGQSGAPTEPCVEYLSGGCKIPPHRVALDAPAIALAAGAEHSCAVLAGGDVACWGRNEHGALGFTSDQVCHPNWRGFCDSVPQRVEGVSDAVQLVASRSSVQTWALTASGRVLVWPEVVVSAPDPRPALGACQQPERALTSAAASARAQQLLGQRVRVRGTVSPGRPLPRLGSLLLQQGIYVPQGQEVVVDGKVMGFLSGRGAPTQLGLYVYDACAVRPPP